MTSPLGDPSTPAVITGGASGIGAACAAALAAVNRPVAIWDLDAARAEQVATRLRDDHGAQATAVPVDVVDDAAVTDAVAFTVAALGSIGGLVHAAGIVRGALDDVIDADTWDGVLATHLRAYAFVTRAVFPELRGAGPGAAIVGISSIEGLVGHGFIPSYTAAKHGMIGLTRSFAHRLGPDGIRVNAVCPGYIDTPMLAPTIQTTEARAAFERRVPLGRLGEADEIARVVRFLLSNESSYLHGAAVVVDGGVTATGGQ
ncbi:MAG TPA: SDR family oxidoreductase [Acidimicrobiia bacterium]|nr:SDR family oxidoreductase [Acidimicrobiia bacterium]